MSKCHIVGNHMPRLINVFTSAEKPSIIEHPQPQLTVAESTSAEITCVVTGKPDPIITWYRDRSLITGGRFKILPTGNLHIEVN